MLDEVWAHQESTYHGGNLSGFRNYLWDQILAAGGNITHCVRWESGTAVRASHRDQTEAQLQRQFQKWMDAMTEDGLGWNGCPGGADHPDDMSLWLTDGFGGGHGGDWDPGVGGFVMRAGGFVMRAGSATRITELDTWMLRDWWRHLKVNRGWAA